MTAVLSQPAATAVEPGPPCDCCGDRWQPKEKQIRGRLPLLICVEPTPCINRAIIAGLAGEAEVTAPLDDWADDAMAIVNGEHPVIAEFEHVLSDDALFDAEFAALLRDVTGAPRLPMTCASPEAHVREARRTKPLWWLRLAGLLDGDRDDLACPICGKPLPKSHRRKP